MFKPIPSGLANEAITTEALSNQYNLLKVSVIV